MKKILFAATIAALSLIACKKDDAKPATPVTPTETGTFALNFENHVGNNLVQLDSGGSTNYRYQTADGQPFNLTLLGYYVTEIVLEGPNGEVYHDKIQTGAAASDVKGFYHVLETDDSSQFITLNNVPAGTYNKITFTVGINEKGMKQGAMGGVLDPANGAWFWSWNSGFIGFAVEGQAPGCPQPYKDFGGGFVLYEHQYQLHVGGWKDVPADSTGEQTFVNNVRTLSFNLTDNVIVSEHYHPSAHFNVDVLEFFKTPGHNFDSTYAVHTPKLGQPYANVLKNVFKFSHVHQ